MSDEFETMAPMEPDEEAPAPAAEATPAEPQKSPAEQIAEMTAAIKEWDAKKRDPSAKKADKSKYRKHIRTLRAKIIALGGTPPEVERMAAARPVEAADAASAGGKAKARKTKQISVKVQGTAQAGFLDTNPQYVAVGKLGDGSILVVDKGAGSESDVSLSVVDPTGTFHEAASTYLGTNHPYLFSVNTETQTAPGEGVTEVDEIVEEVVPA